MGKNKKKHEDRRAGSQFKKEPERPSGAFTLGDFWPKQKLTPPVKGTSPSAKVVAPVPKIDTSKSSISLTIARTVPKKEPTSILREVLSKLPSHESGVLDPKAVTQHSGSNERRQKYEREMLYGLEQAKQQQVRPIPIMLGVDLGTSCTKVVWRDEDENRAYPLCFGDRPNILDEYLLPSVVAFDGDHFAGGNDIAELLRHHPKAERFSNFKMCLACVNSVQSSCNLQHCPLSHWRPVLSKHLSEEEAVEIVTTLHLGKVFSLSKNLVRRKLEAGDVRGPIHWTVNMAAPVEHMGDTDVLSAFERVLRTGWLMAEIFDEQTGARHLDDLLDCYRSARHLSTIRTLDCFVIPEVGAEVMSMCLSRAARDGLYAFVDVGAGTLDASFFRLHFSGDTPQLSFYSAGVIKAGAAHLESIASRQLAEKAVGWFRHLKESHSSEGGNGFLEPNEAKGFLKRAETWLSEEVEAGIRRISASAFKKEMNHNEWKKLILVLGGGGAAIPVYNDASKRGVDLLAPNIHVEQLPVPKDMNMQGLLPSTFHRFAVAYGLSFNIVNLPDFNLPHQVTADRPRPIGGRPESITPDVG